ncbi:MAG: hypothetical protein M1816_001757 [Peltula sp. TS41687]|nr:MAG: hypothetical protein M1816_001757 [Peltula sp. TS41687]
MDSTDYGGQDGPGPHHHPANDSTGGQIYAQQSSAFSHNHSHYGHFQDDGTSSSFNPAWNVNSPYDLSSIQQEPFNAHDPHATYSYVPHQQSFATQSAVPPTRSPAQYDPTFGSGFQSFNHSLDAQVYNSTLDHALRPRIYQPNSAYASEASYADHDLEMATLPDYGSSATAGATVSPYALLNVPTPQRTDDRGQTSQEYPESWNVSTALDASPQPDEHSKSSSSDSISPVQPSGNSTTADPSNPPDLFLPGYPHMRIKCVPLTAERRLERSSKRRRARKPAGSASLRKSINERCRLYPEYMNEKKNRRKRIVRVSVPRRRTQKTLAVKSEAIARRGSDPQSDPASESESEEDTDESDEESEEPEVSPLPLLRYDGKDADTHDGRVAAIRYDTMEALWRPRREPLLKEQIMAALGAFSHIATGFRDRWAAIGKDEAEKLGTPEAIKDRYRNERALLETCLTTAFEHGHEFIVEKIGEHRLFISHLCKVLLDRIKDDDYTATSVTTILDFLSRVTLTQEFLDQLKFSKIKARLEKRGNDKTRELLKKIDEKVASASRSESKPSSKEEPVDGTTSNPSLPEETRPTSTQGLVAGTKRPNENDNGQAQPSKKQATAVTTTAVSGLPKMTKSPGLFGRPITPTTSSQSAATSAALTNNKAKPKTSQPTSVSTGFFTGLKPASKVNKTKPGAAVPKLRITQSTLTQSRFHTPEPPATKTAPTGPPRPAFSIFDALNSLNKVKADEAQIQEAKKLANETPEEKKRRLRREERRKLRVKFKPEDSLVEIRYFTHDQEEDVGREDNLLRDAADAVEEGRMFKQHKELDVMDDDDDDMREGDRWKVRAADYVLKAYELPLPVKVDMINAGERAEMVVTRAGVVGVDSPERAREDERQGISLSVHYLDSADIPSNSTEPHISDDFEFNPELMFGPLPSWVAGRDATVITTPGQLQDQTGQPAQPAPPAPAIPVSTILARIAELQGQQSTQNQAPMTELERTFARHSEDNSVSLPIQQSQHPVYNPAQGLDVQQIAATSTNPQSFNQPQQSLGPHEPNIQTVLAQLAQLAPAAVQVAPAPAQQNGSQNRDQQADYWAGIDNERRDWIRSQRDVVERRDTNRNYQDYDRRSDYQNGSGREYGRARNESNNRRGSFEGRRNVS